jgi:hypothetical protein
MMSSRHVQRRLRIGRNERVDVAKYESRGPKRSKIIINDKDDHVQALHHTLISVAVPTMFLRR